MRCLMRGIHLSTDFAGSRREGHGRAPAGEVLGVLQLQFCMPCTLRGKRLVSLTCEQVWIGFAQSLYGRLPVLLGLAQEYVVVVMADLLPPLLLTLGARAPRLTARAEGLAPKTPPSARRCPRRCGGHGLRRPTRSTERQVRQSADQTYP